MKNAMKKNPLQNSKPLVFFITLSTVLALTSCGDAKTTIIEKEPIAIENDGHDHEGVHDHEGEVMGRLLVVNPDAIQAQVFDLADDALITTIPLDALPSAVYATGGYRFAALIERNADKVGFIDGGLWQEPHDDHFDLVTTLPMLMNNSLTGSRPTHFIPHEGQVAVFFDGDASTGSNASVQVFSDEVVADADMPATLNLNMPMHGVAEPRGELLFATIRQEDVLSTSTNFILPDQVGVYHLHDGDYELEQTLEVTCSNLHGAAQNESHVVFGCGDGILVAAEGGGEMYIAEKILNPDTIAEGARIGSLWGHEGSKQFIGAASSDDVSQFFVVDIEEGEIEIIDWQPMENAKPVARDFAFEAEQFVILDDQGYLTLIEPHQEGGHTHWEYSSRLDITEADVSLMPEGMKFSMAFAQNGHAAYIADPISEHIVVVDLEMLTIVDEIELDYAPGTITWLGIAEEHND